MILFSCGDEMHVDEREEEAFRAQVQVNNNVYKTRSTLTFHTFHFSAYFAQTFDFSNGHLSFLSLFCPDLSLLEQSPFICASTSYTCISLAGHLLPYYLYQPLPTFKGKRLHYRPSASHQISPSQWVTNALSSTHQCRPLSHLPLKMMDGRSTIPGQRPFLPRS